MKFMPTLILQSAVVFPLWGLCKKILFGCHLFLHNYHVLKFEKLQILTVFMTFSVFELKIRVFDEVYAYLIPQFAVVFPA